MKQIIRLLLITSGIVLTLTGCGELKKVAHTVVEKHEFTYPKPAIGRIKTFSRFPTTTIPSRDIHVWLPDGYEEAAEQGIRFATLYMHDGQMLFDSKTTWNGQEWGIDESMQQLIEQQALPPFIVVGINNAGDDLRWSEYMPQKPFESLTQAEQQQVYDGLDSDAEVSSDDYLKFIVGELIPFIDRNFKTDKTTHYIGGASMGGLISWYAVAEYPDVFRGCLCLSTHLPGGFDMQSFTVYDAFAQYMQQKLPVSGSHALYFSYGDQTLDQHYGAYHDKLRLLFDEMNADPNKVTINYFAGDAHNEEAWRTRFPDAILSMFH